MRLDNGWYRYFETLGEQRTVIMFGWPRSSFPSQLNTSCWLLLPPLPQLAFLEELKLLTRRNSFGQLSSPH